MIDWLSAILPVEQIVNGGVVMTLSPDGELMDERLIPLKVAGSWSDQVRCFNVWRRRADRGNPIPVGPSVIGTSVYISGNPAKYLQGHNVYGSDNLSLLSAMFFKQVAINLGFGKDTQDLWFHIGLSGRYEPTRIDITYNYRVEGGSEAVNHWLRAAQVSARVSHKHAGIFTGNTLYFGKHSRRHTIKMYNKYQDLLVHKPCHLIRDIKVIDSEYRIQKKLTFKSLGMYKNIKSPNIFQWVSLKTIRFNVILNRMYNDADGLLRVEQTFRGKKLRDLGFDLARGLDAMKVRELFVDGMKTFTLSAQVVNTEISPLTVGKAPYKTYLAWMGGFFDVRCYHRNTILTHRKALLPYGVDITLPRQEGNQPVVVPLIRTLEAVPVSAPSFYHFYGLLAAA